VKFGPTPLAAAEGAFLAHGLKVGTTQFKKGRRLSAEDMDLLRANGFTDVVVARLEPADLDEDTAAARIAAVLSGEGVTVGAAFTGRVNLFAHVHGLLVVDPARIDRINAIDEAVTTATLPAFTAVAPRQMLATVKIIPFAAPEAAVVTAEAIAREGAPLVAVRAFRARDVALIQTRLPGTKESVLDKTVAVTADRVSACNSRLLPDVRVPHESTALAEAIVAVLAQGAELVLVAGASAITDRRDVLPDGIERAGGRVEHFGMPVDPGNLLLLARIGSVPVLGLPGCARSPKLNGFDWVLQRLLADVPVQRADVVAMGVGGLLTEIPTRPLPRADASPRPAPNAPQAPRVTAVVLAAGRGTRMGGPNKLALPLDGRPLVDHVVAAAQASQADRVIVVTGHEPERVRAALAGRSVAYVHNPDHADGLSTSLRAGLSAVAEDADAVVVLLADMPRVTPAVIDRLIAAYAPVEGRSICVPTVGGRRGNPILWDRRFLTEMSHVEGDAGARALLDRHGDVVCEVPMTDDATLADVDTPDAYAAITAKGR
jgi:molybdenum cofactor cytidylyltransferase